MAGEGRRARSPPGSRAQREAPRPEAGRGGRSALGLRAPRASETSPPRSPSATKGRKVTCGRRGGRARRGVGTRLALASCSAVRRRLRAGGSRSSGALGSPAPLCRRHGGSAELRRGPRPDTERATRANLVPTSLPSAGEGAPQFCRTPRLSSPLDPGSGNRDPGSCQQQSPLDLHLDYFWASGSPPLPPQTPASEGRVWGFVSFFSSLTFRYNYGKM
ncbi:hypothetical protein NN561_012608 [Cricetulus griseus]